MQAGGGHAWDPLPSAHQLHDENSSEIHLPLVSLLSSSLFFFSQKNKGLAASASQYHYTYILGIHHTPPMFFPPVPLLTNLSIA